MKKILNDKIWPAVLSEVQKAINNRSEKNLLLIKSYFSAGRKFDGFKQLNTSSKHTDNFKFLQPKVIQEEAGYVLNPFQAQSYNMILDLLTDSGTNTLTKDQINFKNWYLSTMPPIQINAYAGLTPKSHLNDLIKMIFGQNFNFNLALQGRAAEKLILGALCGAKVLQPGDKILSNRPFDTTKGQIQIRGLEVEALTPMPTPETFINAESVFMGNLKVSDLQKHDLQSYNTILLTMTDNGSGGQPVSMKNVKQVAAFAKKNNKLFWIDACRVFENAAFIKAFEAEYANNSLQQIVRQVSNFADIMTVSFKKIYSHGGGGILVNKNSKILAGKIDLIDRGIKNATTADYGNGFDSYSGITGEEIIEIMSGLICGINQNIVAERIAQLGYVGMVMRRNFNLPIISGGHALYIAADQVVENVPLDNCPAQYLNAILMNALQVRGCGLGHIVYSKRENGKIVSNDLNMDSLRLAIPRQTYTNEQILERMSLLGKAYKMGMFKSLKGGLIPIDYVSDGFYHFGAKYELVDKKQFDGIVHQIKSMQQ